MRRAVIALAFSVIGCTQTPAPIAARPPLAPQRVSMVEQTVSSAPLEFRRDGPGADEVRKVIADDFSTYLSGGDALFDYDMPSGQPVAIDAPSLYREFTINELAADTKFRGKTILVRGAVMDVQRDLWNGRAYVTLASSPTFQIRAYLDRTQENQASSYQMGQSVELLCAGGAARDVLAARLSDCGDAASFKSEVVNAASDEAMSWLTSGKTPAFADRAPGSQWKPALFLAYWSGEKALPLQSITRGVSDQAKQQIRRDYLSAPAYLRLPPLPANLQAMN